MLSMAFLKNNKLTDIFIQFFKFSIVGLSNTIIAYGLYILLVRFGVYYIVANIISFFVGIVNSFFWNSKFVFKKKEKKGMYLSFIKTAISYAFTGIILANFLLYFFVEVLEISKYLAPLVGLVITVPSNFFLNKYWVFREQKLLNE
jgi:putative flippase GtrA